MFTSGCKEKSLSKAFKSVDLNDALLPLGIKPESQKGRTNLTVNDIFSCKSSIPRRNKLGGPNYLVTALPLMTDVPRSNNVYAISLPCLVS